MIVYYNIVLWEELDDMEKLKTKANDFIKRFQGYGLLSYNMRPQQATMTPEQEQAYYQQLQQEQYRQQQEVEQIQQQQIQQSQPKGQQVQQKKQYQPQKSEPTQVEEVDLGEPDLEDEE